MYPALNGTLVAGRTPWPEFAFLAQKTGFPGVDVDIKGAMEHGASRTQDLLKLLPFSSSSKAVRCERACKKQLDAGLHDH